MKNFATLALLGLVSADFHGPYQMSERQWTEFMNKIDEVFYHYYTESSKALRDAANRSKEMLAEYDCAQDDHCG